MRGWVVIVVACACRSAPAPSPIATSSRPDATRTEPRHRMVVTSTEFEILDPIRFLTGSATIDPRSTPILDSIASTLTGNPSIKLVQVRAYGADALAQFRGRVGADRAQAIVDQLVARGVKPSRLLARGEPAPPPGTSVGPVFEILARDP